MLGRYLLGYLPVQAAQGLVGFGSVAIFTRLTFAHLLEYAEKPTIGSVVQVSAENDHYVFASEGAQLHESNPSPNPSLNPSPSPARTLGDGQL